MKKEFSFYEFVGVIAPGAILLIGLQYCFPAFAGYLKKPDFSLGDLGVFIILSYVLGHLIAAVGNLLEYLYWRCWQGKPTQWIRKEDCAFLDGSQIKVLPEKLTLLLGFPVHSPKDYEPDKWHSITRQVAAALHQAKVADRMEIFNGNYGLLRGMAAALLVITPMLPLCKGLEAWPEALFAAFLFVMAVYRMHRFGCHYARELYVQALQLKPAQEAK